MTERLERQLSDHLHAHPLPEEMPDLGMRSVQLGQRMRRRRISAIIAALVLLITIPGTAAWLRLSDADGPLVTSSSTASLPTAPRNTGVEWGPDIPFWSLKGVP